MKIRLGYVAIALTLNKVTSSSLMTYSYYKKLDVDSANSKLDKVIVSNFEDLEKIILYNIKNSVHFYRLSSQIIPLATHESVNFECIERYDTYFKRISKLINDSDMRVDTHPDQFCVLNSESSLVVQNSISILEFHRKFMEKMGIRVPIAVIHVGSKAGGKKEALNRFKKVFNTLNDSIKSMITIENDDKIYNIRNVLKLCNELNIPMTLDFHHYLCNNNDEKIENYIEKICNTWNNGLNPKIHFSSSKGRFKQDKRTHSDYINSDKFIEFIEKIKFINRDIDIMLETKMKDVALFNLMREIKYKTDYKMIDDTTFEVF